jgi:hypothetical protein
MTMETERVLERLAAAEPDDMQDRAPARLKSVIYSALVERMAEEGPLRGLAATRKDGGRLCVFEAVLTVVPGSDPSANPCRVCHARVLGERLERAPVFWPGCPYAKFHHG